MAKALQIPQIVFQERVLPHYAGVFDVATTNSLMHAYVDYEDTRARWWWSFPICAGVTRSERSDIVLDQIAWIQRLLNALADELRSELKRRFPVEPEQIICDWKNPLVIMRDEAARADICVWRGVVPTTLG